MLGKDLLHCEYNNHRRADFVYDKLERKLGCASRTSNKAGEESNYTYIERKLGRKAYKVHEMASMHVQGFNHTLHWLDVSISYCIPSASNTSTTV